MTDINNVLFNHVNTSFNVGGANAKTHSAWKAELEKQAYERNHMAKLDHAYTADTAKHDGLDGSSFGKQAEPSKSGGVDATLKNIERLDAAKSTSALSTIDASTVLKKDVGLHYIMTANSVSKSENTLSASHKINIDVRATAWQSTTFENKELMIRVLPDGEVLVRNYINSNSDVKSVNELVSAIKHIFGDDIEKLKLNGDMVWEKNKLSSYNINTTYSINLIY
jgi:hypothetical protein